MTTIEKFKKENSKSFKSGVYYLSNLTPNKQFEELYIKIRTLEGRIYDDETVSKFPEIGINHRHNKEWSIRKKSSEKLIEYLSGKKRELNILDLGCGNGWFANKLSGINSVSVFGVDINQRELEQAAKIFGNKNNLVFAYADIFESKIDELKFDIIILAGVLMYFKDLNALINKLRNMINCDGEIHILDNALYNIDKVDKAKKRTLEHYKKMGIPEMAEHINHHLLSEFDVYKPEILYNPNTTINKLKRKFSSDSPFYWMKIRG